MDPGPASLVGELQEKTRTVQAVSRDNEARHGMLEAGTVDGSSLNREKESDPLSNFLVQTVSFQALEGNMNSLVVFEKCTIIGIPLLFTVAIRWVVTISPGLPMEPMGENISDEDRVCTDGDLGGGKDIGRGISDGSSITSGGGGESERVIVALDGKADDMSMLSSFSGDAV
ncbi:hypothetical protein AMATHDRAFT_7580 [Amanita thiersii Skay4041]|uniref:Uncharacterized protein n=1 Tax=Amanita thiersii Skay4041 TaxID=703135 RepID=A0A2A9NFT4_9AGAR|nr:hypothetical protein AMATHDRAFT_7580 [Amanita thiersii Skay4041]